MHFLKAATLASFSLAALSAPALAASTCANDTDMAAFRTAAVQQQLMVAALTCHDVEAYNRFVLAYQPELQKSDSDLKAYFVRRGSEAEYDTFKTKLANLSSLSDIANGPAYCSNAAAAFDMALKSRQALSSFVADQRLMIALPKQTMCNEPAAPVLQAAAARPPVKLAEANPAPKPTEKVKLAAAPPPPAAAQADVAVSVPSHDLPAIPYGSPYGSESAAPPPPAAYVHDVNDDEDLAPPPPRPARPRMTESMREREQYYAARYAEEARGWATPPPDDAQDYTGR